MRPRTRPVRSAVWSPPRFLGYGVGNPTGGFPQDIPGDVVARYESGAGIVGDGSTISEWQDQGLTGQRRFTTVWEVETKTGWRQANDLQFTAEPAYGTDEKGRNTPNTEGTGWGKRAFGASYSGNWLFAFRAKLNATGGTGFLSDQNDTVPAVIYHTADTWRASIGTLVDSGVSTDTDWHTFILVHNSGGNDALWLDGSKIIDAELGTAALTGITLFANDLGGSVANATCSAHVTAVNVTDIPTAVAKLNTYLLNR